jgi:hypothetical protein
MGMVTALFLEEHMVVGVRVERRVEVNEVHGLVSDLFSENPQIVAEEELIFPRDDEAKFYCRSSDLKASERNSKRILVALKTSNRVPMLRTWPVSG